MSKKHFILVLNPKGETLPLGDGTEIKLQQISSIGGLKRGIAEVTAKELASVLKRYKTAEEVSEEDYQKYVKKKPDIDQSQQIHLQGSGLNRWPSLQIATSVGSVRVDYSSTESKTKHMTLPGDVASAKPDDKPEKEEIPAKEEPDSLISDEDFDFADEEEIAPPVVDDTAQKEKIAKAKSSRKK